MFRKRGLWHKGGLCERGHNGGWGKTILELIFFLSAEITRTCGVARGDFLLPLWKRKRAYQRIHPLNSLCGFSFISFISHRAIGSFFSWFSFSSLVFSVLYVDEQLSVITLACSCVALSRQMAFDVASCFSAWKKTYGVTSCGIGQNCRNLRLGDFFSFDR